MYQYQPITEKKEGKTWINKDCPLQKINTENDAYKQHRFCHVVVEVVLLLVTFRFVKVKKYCHFDRF